MSAQALVQVPRTTKIFSAATARAQSITAHTDVIDRIPKPILVIDADRRIHACNRAAKAMLVTPLSPLRLVAGRLHGFDTNIDSAIAFQIFALGQLPNLLFSDQVSSVQAPMRSQWVAVSASCLQAAATDQDTPRPHYVLLTVHPVLTHCEVDLTLLQAALGLSRSEARICAHIYAGMSLRETALKMGIGQSTVKTHLQSVFAKTHISKQTELVKLVASLL